MARTQYVKLSNRYVHEKKQILRAFLIIILIYTISCIVNIAGGTEMSFTHLMYIPIILSALHFDIIGAIGASFICGLALGPFMPKNSILGIMQEPGSWIFRCIMFSIVGTITAILFKHIRSAETKEIEYSFQNYITGLPNTNKLKLDLDKMAHKTKKFSLIGFKIINMDDINRYTNYEIGIQSLKKAIETLKSHVDGNVYSIHTNEFAVILPEKDLEETRTIGMQFLNAIKDPLLIDGYNIELTIKGGFVNFPDQAQNPDDLIKKLGFALAEETNENGLQVYDAAIELKYKERYELVVALFGAIKNKEFFLVYQPKRNLSNNSILGVEALLRWNHGMERHVNTEEFIKIAEEIGLISEITKWIIKNVMDQIKIWEEEGISTKVALNISPRDLRDFSVVNYLIESIEENAVEPSMIEIELTERGIIENEKKALQLLNKLNEQGIKISLDDFGTGYNSLVDLVKIPIDNIKIDKIFVDNILDYNNQVLIETIISFAHKTGRKVIAEGVEDKEQLELLKIMGCDYIQGYYFSKPLTPEEFIQFHIAQK